MTTSLQEQFPTTSFGEMVETIVSMRCDGRYGLYLGSDAKGVETVRVGDMTFKVGPQAPDGCITVLHVESGAIELADCGEELCYAVDRALQSVLGATAGKAAPSIVAGRHTKHAAFEEWRQKTNPGDRLPRGHYFIGKMPGSELVA